MSYYQTLQHVDFEGKVNDEVVYHNFLTGNTTSTFYCYQFYKKGDSRHDHDVKTGCFWSKSLHNLFAHNLGLEAQFERSDDK